MDLALSRIIKSRTSIDELDDAYKKSLTKMVQILQLPVRTQNKAEKQPKYEIEDILCLYEGNIWSIIHKYQGDITVKNESDKEESMILNSLINESNDFLSPNSVGISKLINLRFKNDIKN